MDHECLPVKTPLWDLSPSLSDVIDTSCYFVPVVGQHGEQDEGHMCRRNHSPALWGKDAGEVLLHLICNNRKVKSHSCLEIIASEPFCRLLHNIQSEFNKWLFQCWESAPSRDFLQGRPQNLWEIVWLLQGEELTLKLCFFVCFL